MKINWGSLGKNVLTLGIGYLIERVVAKKVPKQLTKLLVGATEGADTVPPEVRDALSALITAQMRLEFQRVEELGRNIEANIAKLDEVKRPPRARRK
jgi:hypothetical protein